MKLLENPRARYGQLPPREKAAKLLAPHQWLQTREGALDYLEKHIGRVEELYSLLTEREMNMWAVLQRLKAKKQFTNTVRALRVIMVWHSDDRELLAQMKSRLEEKREQGGGLQAHFAYLLSELQSLLQDSG